jgi:hypothetical protein
MRKLIYQKCRFIIIFTIELFDCRLVSKCRQKQKVTEKVSLFSAIKPFHKDRRLTEWKQQKKELVPYL